MAVNNSLPSRILEKLKANQERASANLKEKKIQIDDERATLSNWSDSVRRVPNVALRSALFSTSNRECSYLERVEVNALGGIDMVYTGAQLDQCDLDVWEAVLHVAQMTDLGSECRITAYSLLKILGKTDAGNNRNNLESSISRLKATALQVRAGKYSYEGSLIQDVYREQYGRSTRTYVIRLNPKLRVLFVNDRYTDVDWGIRRLLQRKPLAQWLYGFYSSHARPFDLKVETLHRLCGSHAKTMGDFKKDLRRALDAVARVSNAAEKPFSYFLEGQLVKVKTTPSASQKRHLNKRV